MSSLIESDNVFAVAAILFGLVYVGLMAERTRLGAKLSAPLIALASGMLFSNLRVLPFESPAYGFVIGYLVPLSIPLLLLKADLRRIFTETGPTLIAFLAGAVGTALGAVLGFFVIDVGPETHKIVGVLAASFIGGSFNFVAVSQALEVADSTLIGAAATAQGVAAIFYLGLLILAPSIVFLQRSFDRGDEAAEETAEPARVSGVDVGTVAERSSALMVPGCVAFSLIVCAISYALAEALGVPQFSILFITILTVAVASMAPRQAASLDGAESLGLLGIYVFIAAVGAQSNIWQLAGTAPILMLFLTVLLVVHALFVLAAGWLFRLSLPEILIGSNACTLGAATAAAIAAGKRWDGLVTPGILSGILGYVIANFIGVGLAGLLMWMASN